MLIIIGSNLCSRKDINLNTSKTNKEINVGITITNIIVVVYSYLHNSKIFIHAPPLQTYIIYIIIHKGED